MKPPLEIPPETKIHVLLVDDHPLVRECIRAGLGCEPNITVVGEAENGLEAIEQTALLNPHVILLDIHMPKMSGIEAAKILREQHPSSEILVLSMNPSDEYEKYFFRLGVKGFISKEATSAEIADAVKRVSAGQFYEGVKEKTLS